MSETKQGSDSFTAAAEYSANEQIRQYHITGLILSAVLIISSLLMFVWKEERGALVQAVAVCFVAMALTHLRIFLIKRRLRLNLYGTNPEEARQIMEDLNKLAKVGKPLPE